MSTAVWTVYIRRPGCLHGLGKDMRQEITLLVCERHDKKEKRDDGRGRAKGPLRPPNIWIWFGRHRIFLQMQSDVLLFPSPK